MKKELFASALLLAIFSFSLLTTHYIDHLSQRLVVVVQEAEAYAEKGDWEAATAQAEKATEIWRQSSGVTQIVLRHAEVDSLTDAMYEFLEEVCDENPRTVPGAARAVIDHISRMAAIESIRLGSVF